MRYLNQIKRDFENLSMKNKLLAVVLSNVVLILLIALMGLRISSSAYNEQLYKAIAGNLTFSSQTISGNLNSIETLSSVIISSSVQDIDCRQLHIRLIPKVSPLKNRISFFFRRITRILPRRISNCNIRMHAQYL